ncbi:50S ribosomal protein L3 [Legionella beliardensis]|uniref:Large ribosomal subunit protein uL3 n=1 Tax=Legionella beliardensis TaxID=91822 RepID=A0A378HXW1_9GAMM|nr:50S ribosomal protein L3 [Legionella beliardensis]STX27748.1 50S ribosomal protein L3 [Legionella beliardensis]
MTTLGLIGRKVGMTRIFTDDGVSIPVSVVEVLPNRVSQIKTLEKDGYIAVQITAGEKKSSRVSKPLAGHFAKAQIEAGDMIGEFVMDSTDAYQAGQEINVADVFTNGQYVDVCGTSKGKGFAGTVKRYNFRTQDATHGNSRSHRVPGSIGQNQTPGKVFKGKKMAGHMGNARCTTQNLELVRIDAERNLLLIKGAIPGCPGAKVRVTPAVKKKARGE